MDIPKFKQCPCCKTWFTAREILECDQIRPEGMLIDDEDLEINLYYFTHMVVNCRSTFTMLVTDFEPFLDESVPDNILAGSRVCEGHCTNFEDLKVCKQNCRWATYRRLMHKMLETRKCLMVTAAE